MVKSKRRAKVVIGIIILIFIILVIFLKMKYGTYGLKKTLSNEEENEYAVQNGLYSTSFYFDANDRVYKIACGTGV